MYDCRSAAKVGGRMEREYRKKKSRGGGIPYWFWQFCPKFGSGCNYLYTSPTGFVLRCKLDICGALLMPCPMAILSIFCHSSSLAFLFSFQYLYPGPVYIASPELSI
ncbi:uncharacterized protein BO72DRAFT_52559 [Aspergillus fijiensis CBS 313.89]|uniref:Uncharacterized protein n=1 Tax=Aspergillus fijiensis CBS 313.89 TaxID=1448319 RepID=A0A8G1RX32_9EURO|nr:uncharacterized protein BO72DRAFT_52559 [Aspergillus fijiensis CBS 313.89]RAK79121.1 hypothetical protein BO72DRAFT_52559 [Aspergillus fijiensis CBS 313.89]